MDKDDLQNIWRLGNQKTLVQMDRNQLVGEMTRELKGFDAKLKSRDSREIIVAILLIPVALAFAWFMESLLIRIGFALVIPYCLLVIYMLKRVKKHKKAIAPDLDQKTFLELSKTYLIKEMNLLKSVLYWYILPAILCTSLILLGSNKSILELVFSFTGMALIFGYIYHLNRKAVKKDFEPLISQLEKTIEIINH